MKQLFILPLFLLPYCLCTAQVNPSHHHFNLLSIKEGMPEGSVRDLFQDKEGYMWIATQKGLVRYDGYKPKVYDFGITDPYGKFVDGIFEDSKGRLWTATFNGLYVYDRTHDNFVKYLHWNTKFLNYALKEDASGDIWLSQDDTLIRFDPTTKKTEIFSSKAKGKYTLDAKHFFEIYKDKEHRIWVCSDNGLYEYNVGKNVFIGHLSDADSSKQITTLLIHEDAQRIGIFYFDVYNSYPYRNEGLGRYNANTDSLNVFHYIAKDVNSIASDTLTASYLDSKGRLWITSYRGLSLFNPLNQNFTNYVPDPVDAFKNVSVGITIKEDKVGNLWCSSNIGLYYFDVTKKQFQRDTVDANFSNGLKSNSIVNLFIDRSGLLWFGQLDQKGLQWMDTRRSKFIQYGSAAVVDVPFKAGRVNSFAGMPDGSVWMGTAGGLYQVPLNGSLKQVHFRTGKNDDGYVGCFPASKGLLWLANYNKGRLYCYETASGKIIDSITVVKDAATSNFAPFSCLREDHAGDIWVGTWGNGIARFNSKSKSFTRFPFIYNDNNRSDTHGALDDDQVECIYEDKQGTIWVGTNNGGLNRFNRDNATFTSYNERLPGLSCVVGINEDSKGRLWASTFFGGLFMLDKNRDSIKRFSETEGLLYDGIWASEEDNKGNIWAATQRGISILDPVKGEMVNVTSITNFAGPAIRTKEGNFYFSTDNGFVTLDPNDFAPDKEPPIVHIESVHLSTFIKDKPKDSAIVVDTVRKYSFRYNENRITFNYVGLYYRDPMATQYAYKLKGYDKDWVQAGTQRTITYTNLSPGNYTFYVKAANSDGVWSDGNAAISFSILPPWWQTWWADAIYAVCAAVAIWAFVAYRSRNLKRRNVVLEQKVINRTEQLNKSLEELKSTQTQLIQSEKMASLGELTAGIAHEIQNPLNFVNNFSDVNSELIDEAEQQIDKGNVSEAKTILNDLRENEQKINHHGRRADAIVKGMLQHSRTGSATKEPADINRLADEYLRLAFQGFRARDKSFNATFSTEFDNGLEKVDIVPQEIGSVILNLINNAFYAVNERAKQDIPGYEPTVIVGTRRLQDRIEISVRDNGNGIPGSIKNKIFQPFFTTKPTGQGTGLGLSLAYDIVKAHGGEIKVGTKEGEGSEFIIHLPSNPGGS